MDVCLDTLSYELCQVNTRVGHIAWRQAVIGGFTVASSPSPEESEDDEDDADEDDGANSPSDDEMTDWFTYHLSFVTKKESSFDMRVVMVLGGELV